MFSKLKDIKSGLMLALVSTFVFSVMGVFAKLATKTIPASEVVFFRSFISLIIIISYMRHKKISLTSGNKKILFLRGLLGSAGLILSFYALAGLKLSESSILFQTCPIFVVIFARIFLKERLPRAFYLLMVLSVVGVLLVIKPNFEGMNSLPAFYALLSSVFAAVAYVCIRSLRKDHDTHIIVMYFALTAMIVPIPLMLNNFVVPNLYESIFLLLVGLAATIGQFFMTKAFGVEKAGTVSMVNYTGVFFNMIWDLAIWGVVLDIISLAGGALIILSSIILTIKNREDDQVVRSDEL